METNLERPNSIHFYKNLKPLEKISDLLSDENYEEVPDDWHLIITDVVDSTKAVAAGRYKDVNIAGGISIMAITNINQDLENPFVFGGDGVVLLVPESFSQRARDALLDTQRFLFHNLDLKLRVGVFPMRELRKDGFDLSVAKLKVSDFYSQANLFGTALEEAERRLKDPLKQTEHFSHMATDLPQGLADFSGFSCRWQDIRSELGETISLIIKPNTSSRKSTSDSLVNIFHELEKILGGEEKYHPLSEKNMRVNEDPEYSRKEASVLTSSRKGLKFKLHMMKIAFENAILRTALKLQLPFGPKLNGFALKDLPRANRISSDFRKFDGTLKLVFSATTEDRERLEGFLRKELLKGRLNFGMHISDRALMTCLMHQPSSGEVHFIDAADGGYALASQMLKEQLSDSQSASK